MPNGHPNQRLGAGARIRLSTLGAERCYRLKSHTGTIVRINPGGTSFRVLIDGRKLLLTLHESYVELNEEQRSSKAAG